MLASPFVLLTLIVAQVQSQAALVPQTRSANLANDKREVKMAPETSDSPYGMVLISGGETVVGTDPDMVQKLGQGQQLDMTIIAAETPRHTVQVESFYIDQMEVTNLQWKVFLQATGRQPSDVLKEYGWPGGEIPEGQEYFPITNVNLPEIEEFLAWCGKRLPTEAEWIRAARGDDTRDYTWGEKWNGKLAKYGGNPPPMPVPVDSYADGASPYGVLNMTGNVFEWTDTNYTAFDGFSPITFKQGRDRLLLSPDFDSRRRVIKGGCFVSTRDQSRIDYRGNVDPNDSDAALGFRGARSVNKGVEVIRHGYRRLLPPQIPTLDVLDPTDVFAQEDPTFLAGSDGRILSGFRYLAFAHPKPNRAGGLASMRKSARDEPVTLGLLTTSEPMIEPPLPAGDYVIAYKAKGESKKHKEQRKNKDDKDDDKQVAPAEAAPDGAEAGSNPGSMTPWPGIAVNDILEDIEFPQDKDVFLFFNVNNAVVGWLPTGDITEDAFEPVVARASEGGRVWEIEFSLDIVSRRVPRFLLPIKLHGAGLLEE